MTIMRKKGSPIVVFVDQDCQKFFASLFSIKRCFYEAFGFECLRFLFIQQQKRHASVQDKALGTFK